MNGIHLEHQRNIFTPFQTLADVAEKLSHFLQRYPEGKLDSQTIDSLLHLFKVEVFDAKKGLYVITLH
jgi:hypothetical protein